SDKVPLKGYKYQVQQGKTTSVYIKVSPVGVDASAPLKYFYTSYYTESKDSSSINYSFILMLPRIIKDKPLMTFLTISKKAFENEMFYSQKEYELNLPFREEDYTSEPQSLGVKLWRK
ncbi:MAG: hypothetical protein H6625_12120, partial [Bdellovibrionaceae bacterium]|nr:hypothetical protein [Pseudobdellovibrionaceae bacterium]